MRLASLPWRCLKQPEPQIRSRLARACGSRSSQARPPPQQQQRPGRAAAAVAAAASSAAAAAAASLSESGQMQRKVLRGHIGGFLQRVEEVNNGLQELTAGRMVPFVLDGRQLGYLRPAFADKLLAHPSVFQLAPPQQQQQQQRVVTICPQHATMQQRSDAVAPVLAALRDDGAIRGWRGELYPVAPAFGEPPALLVERAAAPYFGIRAYGVHVNGYVRRRDGGLSLWVARRSKTKPTWPGMLDHIVAGGQPYGLSCEDNVKKECWEEAGIPAELASRAAPAGFVSYVSLTEEGLKPDVLFCYDLELPEDFAPAPQDGEVDEFMLWDVDKVASVISGTGEYKPNDTLVIIDFFARWALLSPDEPGYTKLLGALRSGGPC